MKQLLIRADDIGYSYAVDLGIARSVREGLIRSVGIMPNMPEAERGWSWVKDQDVAVGQHTNLCLGKPCASPKSISSLLNESGEFKSSKEYRESFKQGIDFVDFDEAVIEIEAQHDRFLEIVGREPDYFEAHAVMSENLNRAIGYVAKKHGLRNQPASFDPGEEVLCGQTMVHMVCHSMDADFDATQCLKDTVMEMKNGETFVYVCHPGYLDDFLLKNSSLTANRTKEVDMLIDPDVRAWLESQQDLKLIDYRVL